MQTHGFKLSSVLSDINSVSGIRILTLLAEKGSLSVDDVSNTISSNTKKSATEIQSAICGKLNPNECFLLNDFLEQLRIIQNHIKKILSKMQDIAAPYTTIIEQLDSIVGIDITAALLILAEIGSSPQDNFKTSAHLCSWAGLSPRNDQSAGKIKSKKVILISNLFCVRFRGLLFVIAKILLGIGFGLIKADWVRKRLSLLFQEKSFQSFTIF